MKELTVVDLTKRFGYVKALDKVSFSVNKGDYVVISGPIGAGKTTLLRVIAGLIEPDSGDVVVDGQSVLTLAPEERNFAYMPSGFTLFPHMTVYDNVAYGLRARGLSEDEIKEKVKATLNLVGLWHRRRSYPRELSGGMKQRVALARALVTGSELLLLDEPLSALDLLLNIELRYELRKLAKRLGLTVLHVTHNFEEALSIADKILVMRKGTVQQYGSPEIIYKRPVNLFVASFSGEVNILEGSIIRSEDGFVEVEVNDLGYLRVRSDELRIGERVVIVYRPEDVNVKFFKGSEESYKARIIDARFLGMFLVVEVELPNGRVFRSYMPSYLVEEVKRHSGEVYVELPPDRALVYPYPREGLTKALALG